MVRVDDYGDGDTGFSRDIASQTAVVTGWLTSESLAEEQRFSLYEPTSLKNVRDLRDFLLFVDPVDAAYDEALVVYITGHGLASASGRHYLTFAGTDEERLVGTAFPTAELIGAVVDSEAEHILVLVDSCFAGTLNVEVQQMFRDLKTSRRKLPTIAVVTSGDFDEQPYVGEFTSLMGRTLAALADESAGYTASHLSFEEWEQMLKAVGQDEPGLIEALWVWPPSRRRVPSACLPNPTWQPRRAVVGPAVGELALAETALERYWLARASGQVGDEDEGWYFSGRETLMKELIAFLGHGQGALVVTGAAGSGKSALLARLVTLTDSTFLRDDRVRSALDGVSAALRPEPGSVHAAVLARGKDAHGLIGDLSAALGAPAAPGVPALQSVLAHLHARVGRSTQPVTIVIDGIDEADRPLACLSDVVLPLGRLETEDGRPCVRLLLGMRSSLPSDRQRLQDDTADQLLGALGVLAAGDTAERAMPLTVLRTDESATSREDIAQYVRALLTGPGASPYRGAPRAAAEAAAVVADAVRPSFLDARIAADQLRTADRTQDLDDRAWRERLQDGTTALLREDIRAVAQAQDVPARMLLAVLRATAFASGAGLPWGQVWPTAVRAVLGSPSAAEVDVDRAIRVFRHSRLVGYLANGQEDRRVTYRPVHQRVTEALLDRPQSLLLDVDAAGSSGPDGTDANPGEEGGGVLSRRQVRRHLAREFASLANASSPLAPHPYLRRHLVGHADAAGLLDDRHLPAGVLAHETSRTLRARLGLPLPVADRTRQAVTAAALIEPYADEGVDSPSRLDSIAFHTASLGGAPVTDLPDGAFRTSWSRWRPRTNVLVSPGDTVRTMCALRAQDGRTLVAAATEDEITVWDRASGHSLARMPVDGIRDLRTIRGHSGRLFLVSADAQRVAVWDPLSGAQVASLNIPRRFQPGAVRVLDDGERRWTVAMPTSGGVLLWAPTEGWNDFFSVPGMGPRALCEAARGRDGRRVLVHVPRDAESSARVWDPKEPYEDRLLVRLGHTPQEMTVLPGHWDGDLIAFAHNPAGRAWVSVWNMEGEPVSYLDGPAEQLAAAALPDDRALLVSVSYGQAVLWDVHGRPGSPVREHARPVGLFSVGDVHALTTLPGDPVREDDGTALPRLATAGDEGIRLWEALPPDSHPIWLSPPPPNRRISLPAETLAALPRHDGRAGGELLAHATPVGFDVLDARDGTRTGQFETGVPVRSLRTVSAPGTGPLVTCLLPGRLQTWDLAESRVVDTARVDRPRPWALFLQPDRSPALLIAASGHLRVRDLTTGTENTIHRWSYRRRRPVPVQSLLVVPTPDGRATAVLCTRQGLEMWDLATGEQAHMPGSPAASTRGVRVTALVPRAPGMEPLAAFATTNGLQLWNTHDWTLRSSLATPSTRAVAAVTTPDGTPLIAYGNGTGVHLWDGTSDAPSRSLLTAAPVLNITDLPGRDTPVICIAGPAGIAALTL
ncbi:AAA family ATPase [Kitasatospora sp. NPDC087315]|uniref:AAA family ATPase n=1 Tax=Kitasatospora sp. NPDC087315 TaxID=3364069 RepID=UPI0038091020